jgi:uncharacterized protein
MRDKIKRKVKKMLEGRDPAHDFYHIMRVYKTAKLIGQREGTNMKILLPAVLLHDLVVYPKGSAKSSKSSDESADLAENILQSYGYPQDKINQICVTAYGCTATPKDLFQEALKEKYFKMQTGLTRLVQ